MRFHIRHAMDMTIQVMRIYTRSDSVANQKVLQDISEDGLCFRSMMPYREGARLYIRIPVQDPAFEVRGRVAWCCSKGGQFEIGIKFEQQSIDSMLRMVGDACNIKHYKRSELRKGCSLSMDQAAREWVSRGSIPEQVARAA